MRRIWLFLTLFVAVTLGRPAETDQLRKQQLENPQEKLKVPFENQIDSAPSEVHSKRQQDRQQEREQRDNNQPEPAGALDHQLEKEAQTNSPASPEETKPKWSDPLPPTDPSPSSPIVRNRRLFLPSVSNSLYPRNYYYRRQPYNYGLSYGYPYFFGVPGFPYYGYGYGDYGGYGGYDEYGGYAEYGDFGDYGGGFDGDYGGFGDFGGGGDGYDY